LGAKILFILRALIQKPGPTFQAYGVARKGACQKVVDSARDYISVTGKTLFFVVSYVVIISIHVFYA
jgi:hypothetical protein